MNVITPGFIGPISSPSRLLSEKISLSFRAQQNQSSREIVILRTDE